jgi:low affinity Fe/Cu permease
VLTTGTTSVTFLLVFRIQNPQHRDGTAAQRKPDELLRAGAGAHTARLDLEELAEGAPDRLRGRYQAMTRRARADRLRGQRDTDTADLAERPERPERSARDGPAGARGAARACRRRA